MLCPNEVKFSLSMYSVLCVPIWFLIYDHILPLEQRQEISRQYYYVHGAQISSKFKDLA